MTLESAEARCVLWLLARVIRRGREVSTRFASKNVDEDTSEAHGYRDLAALWIARCGHRRSLDSAIHGSSTTASRDDGAEADCDGRGKCASSKSAAAPAAWRTYVALNGANQIGRPDSANLVEGYRAGQAAGESRARDVAAAVGQSRKSGHDVEPIAPQAKDRVGLQAERRDELLIARLPEAVMDPEERRRSSIYQGQRPHQGDVSGTEAMCLCTSARRRTLKRQRPRGFASSMRSMVRYTLSTDTALRRRTLSQRLLVCGCVLVFKQCHGHFEKHFLHEEEWCF